LFVCLFQDNDTSISRATLIASMHQE